MFTYLNFKSVNEFFSKISNMCLAMNLTMSENSVKVCLTPFLSHTPQKI